MSVVEIFGVVLFYLGVALVALLTLASLRARRAMDRVHYLTPTTSLAAPLIGLGLVLQNGWTLTSAQIVLTCALMMIAGPVLASATVRVAAQRDGSLTEEAPE